MGKEERSLEELRAEETALYRILLEMLKKIKEIIPLTKKRSASVVTYVLLFNHLRKIRAQIKSLDERVADIKDFEKEINKHKIDINRFCKTEKLVYETYQSGDLPIRIDSDLKTYETWEIKDKPKKERISGMLEYMQNLNYILLHFKRPIEGEPKPSTSDNKFYYGSRLPDLTQSRLKKHHYQFAILVAEALIKIKRIIGLLRMERSYKNTIDDFIKRKVIPAFRTELELIKKNFPDKTIRQETELLSQRLRELSSLV